MTWAGRLLIAIAVAVSFAPRRSTSGVAEEIQRRLEPSRLTGLGVSAAESAELRAVYAGRDFEPLWSDARGLLAPVAHEALRLVGDAAHEGFEPEAYDAAGLARFANALGSNPDDTPSVAAFDVGLSRAMLRYFRHLHAGRIDPRALGFRLTPAAETYGFAGALLNAVRSGRIVETAAGLAPPLPEYRRLRAALARYRVLAADPTLTPPELNVPLGPGDRLTPAAARSLRRLLAALGDAGSAPESGPEPELAATYDAELVAAVRHFQERHGLIVDGIVGQATMAALKVPIGWRVRQIELALERLRWAAMVVTGEPLILVNVPMFRLWAWDARSLQDPSSDRPALEMRVIVGSARGTRTPVFSGEMRAIVFRPYWNVPRSIVVNEILPLVRRDPYYLRRQNMEIVAGDGDAAPVVEPTPVHLDQLARGQLRLRQRPGPQNALGPIKFVAPNEYDVDLHGTPAQALFARARRDFSHGCIRVEDPVALTEWVLGDRAQWDRDRVIAATAGADNVTVPVPRSIRVLVFYMTAMSVEGAVMFADDIYGRDLVLDRALQRLPRLNVAWGAGDRGRLPRSLAGEPNEGRRDAL